MSEVNLQLVREFFELHGFSVLTHWQLDRDRARGAESALQLFAVNTRTHAVPEPPGFVLEPADLPAVDRALIEVRAWHADRFYPSVIESNPILAHSVLEESLEYAAEVFDGAAFATVLVISELPASKEPRQRSLELLDRMGIGHVIEFPAILRGLFDRVSAHGAYPSPTLQLLRLLKRYDLVRWQQLEFRFPAQIPAVTAPPEVDATIPPPRDGEAAPWPEDDEEPDEA